MLILSNRDFSKINVHGNNFIHFVVAEKELVVKVYLGEAFLPLSDYLSPDANQKRSETKQLHLKLTKPNEGKIFHL